VTIRPYKFQEEGISFHLENPYSINGCEMGLGKTLMGIVSANRAGAKHILVVCPAFLVPNWHEEIVKFSDGSAEFRVVSYSSIKKIEKEFSKYDTVICDEAHYLKNIRSLRTQAIHKLVKAHRPKRLYLLTGTPVKNSVPEFYSILKLCHYGGKYPEFDIIGNSYHRFSQMFSHREQTPWGIKYSGMKNLQRLKSMVKPVYLRRRAHEVLDLPEEITREVVCSEKDKTDQLLTTAWDAYLGNKKSKSFAAGKAISALAKVQYTVEFVEENLEQMEKVVVFTDHVQAAEKLHKELGGHLITGGVPPAKRSTYVDDINEGRVQVLVATIGALSVGVNITGVNHMVFNDLTWVPADISQVRKRIHRIGQKKTCFYYYILASQVDKAIVKTLEKKRKILEAMEDESVTG